MAKRVSLYDAKAKFSALVREVREGHTVVITVHGIPAAELRPITSSTEHSLEERISLLTQRGEIIPSALNARAAAIPIGERKVGALKRFLRDRE